MNTPLGRLPERIRASLLTLPLAVCLLERTPSFPLLPPTICPSREMVGIGGTDSRAILLALACQAERASWAVPWQGTGTRQELYTALYISSTAHWTIGGDALTNDAAQRPLEPLCITGNGEDASLTAGEMIIVVIHLSA